MSNNFKGQWKDICNRVTTWEPKRLNIAKSTHLNKQTVTWEPAGAPRLTHRFLLKIATGSGKDRAPHANTFGSCSSPTPLFSTKRRDSKKIPSECVSPFIVVCIRNWTEDIVCGVAGGEKGKKVCFCRIHFFQNTLWFQNPLLPQKKFKNSSMVSGEQ